MIDIETDPSALDEARKASKQAIFDKESADYEAFKREAKQEYATTHTPEPVAVEQVDTVVIPVEVAEPSIDAVTICVNSNAVELVVATAPARTARKSIKPPKLE